MLMACRLDVLYGLDVKVVLKLAVCVEGSLLDVLNFIAFRPPLSQSASPTRGALVIILPVHNNLEAGDSLLF